MSQKNLARRYDLFPSFNDLFKPWNDMFENDGFFRRTITTPGVNVTDKPDAYQLSVAAPGLKKDDFNIDVDGNMLTISCEKEESSEKHDEKYTRTEYSYNSFSRSFTLPDEVQQENIEASYTDGVLMVKLPKKENARKAALSKHIAVK